MIKSSSSNGSTKLYLTLAFVLVSVLVFYFVSQSGTGLWSTTPTPTTTTPSSENQQNHQQERAERDINQEKAIPKKKKVVIQVPFPAKRKYIQLRADGGFDDNEEEATKQASPRVMELRKRLWNEALGNKEREGEDGTSSSLTSSPQSNSASTTLSSPPSTTSSTTTTAIKETATSSAKKDEEATKVTETEQPEDEDETTTISPVAAAVSNPQSSTPTPSDFNQQPQQQHQKPNQQQKQFPSSYAGYRVNPSHDQLPSLHEELMKQIKWGRKKILEEISPLPVVENAPYESGALALDLRISYYSDTSLGFFDNKSKRHRLPGAKKRLHEELFQNEKEIEERMMKKKNKMLNNNEDDKHENNSNNNQEQNEAEMKQFLEDKFSKVKITGGIPETSTEMKQLKQKALDSRNKFVQVVSEMFEIFPGTSTTTYTYARPWLRWKLNSPTTTAGSSSSSSSSSENNNNNNNNDDQKSSPSSSPSTGNTDTEGGGAGGGGGTSTSGSEDDQQLNDLFSGKKFRRNQNPLSGPPARLACLYAGFMRDFEYMHRSCTKSDKKCRSKKRRRGYGYQTERLLQPLDCDVFVSTWHLRGAGRYFTTDYNQEAVLNPASYMVLKFHSRLAAIHVHNYTLFGQLWHAAHRFKRSFPQSSPAKETKAETYKRLASHGASLFRHVDGVFPYMRLNDYSQSFKHFCAVLLTWQYESWARGSYDLYFRLRTDERVVRIFHPPVLVWKNTPAATTKEESGDSINKKNGNRMIRYVSFDLCPGPKFGKNLKFDKKKGGVSSASANSKQQQGGGGDDDDEGINKVIVNEESGGGAAVAGANAAAIAAAAAEQLEKNTCDRHTLTASSTSGQDRELDRIFSLFPLPPEHNKNGDDSGNGLLFKQRVAVNSFDIGDLGYLGSAETITYLGTKMWQMCVNKSSAPTQPGFPTNELVTDKISERRFSEYNLMMWKALFDAASSSISATSTNGASATGSDINKPWELESLFIALRISRSLMPTTKKKVA